MRTPLLGLVLALCAAAPDPVHAQAPDPAEDAWAADVASYRLTMDGFHRWARALENLTNAGKKDPSLLESAEMDADAPIHETIARIEAEPRLRKPIEDAGVSVREYLVVSAALVQAMFALAAVEQGMLDEIPEEINPDHIEFVKQNRQEIQQILQRYQQANEGGAI